MKLNKKKIVIILVSLIIILSAIGCMHYNFLYNKAPKRYVEKVNTIESENITLNKVEVVSEEELWSELIAYVKNNTDKDIIDQYYAITFNYDDKKNVQVAFYISKLEVDSEQKILIQTFKTIYDADSYSIREITEKEAENINSTYK